MNIAHIIPHSIAFPLNTHNGRYDWVLQLALLQAEAGHKVTIYGSPDSHSDGIQMSGITQATDDKKRNNTETFRLAFRNNHDIYHSHFDNLHYEVSHETPKPVVFTQHWWPYDETIKLAQASYSKNVWAVPPTKYMYEFDLESKIQSKGFIYHGIDLKLFHPSPAPKTGRLLFVGRISPEKNLDIALLTARKTGVGLDIIGKIAEKNHQYWENLQPLIDGKQIKYLGTKHPDELVDYYTSARALLLPSDVTEAFGLVVIESQACGTPVIMKRGGSREELIYEEKTGYLCKTKDDFIEAATNAEKLNPVDCVTFAKNFDIHNMAKKYESLYKQLMLT